MPANLSLILNLLLLVAVMVAIGHVMKSRRKDIIPARHSPDLGLVVDHFGSDEDVIAIRKIAGDPDQDMTDDASFFQADSNFHESPYEDFAAEDHDSVQPQVSDTTSTVAGQTVMLFLLAKEQRQFLGYDLLQTLLALGLRFGEGSLFHRHQQLNGHGPIMFSLASATASGVFDLQNIGAFSTRGLCLFMQTSGSASIDRERFESLYTTAKQLSEELDAYLLDDQKKPLNKDSMQRYQAILGYPLEVELAV